MGHTKKWDALALRRLTQFLCKSHSQVWYNLNASGFRGKSQVIFVRSRMILLKITVLHSLESHAEFCLI